MSGARLRSRASRTPVPRRSVDVGFKRLWVQEKAEDAETAKFLSEWCRVLDKQVQWHATSRLPLKPLWQEQEENRLKDEAAKKLAEESLRFTIWL